MTMAICFKCGKMKFGAFTQCPECNGEPKTDDEFVISLVMTDHLYNGFEVTDCNLIAKGGRRYLPYVFTKHVVAMLSSVLNSDRAIDANIFIIRAFVKLREMISTHDGKIIQILRIINKITTPPDKPKRKLGY